MVSVSEEQEQTLEYFHKHNLKHFIVDSTTRESLVVIALINIVGTFF